MRLRGVTGRRLIALTTLLVFLGVVIGVILLRNTTRRATLQSLGPAAQHLYDSYAHADCEADPAHWSMALDDGIRAFAYDSTTLQSANPSAPPLDGELLARLQANPDRRWDSLGPLLGGWVLLRASKPGVCGLVQLKWSPPGLAATVVGNVVLLVVVLAAGGSLLVLLLVVRPLIQRLEALRVLATQLGRDSGLATAPLASQNEFDELTEALHDAHRRIRADTEDLQRHLANVAHDLRTPLASLQMTLEQALAEPSGSTQVAAHLSAALNDVVYLTGLTLNLRLASQMEGGWSPATAATSCDLREIVINVTNRARILARARGVAFESAVPDEALPVRCDRFAAEQAISNLVDNAVAYGDSCGHVSVVLDVTRHGFLLEVIDDGPGVTSLELPLLGSRTFRADLARQRDPRGSGLGVAISNEVCRRSGWSLRFSHEIPRGLRATIEGPSAAAT